VIHDATTGASSSRPARALVVGCGGLGGIVSASLLEHGAQDAPDGAGSIDVVTLTTNEAIAAAVNARGFQIRGTDGARTVAGVAKTTLSKDDAPFDWVILAVQPPQVEEAAAAALPWLAPSGSMVCLQNGLCEARVAKIAGEDRVIGAVVAWGGAMPEPGLYERTSAGGFTIGRMTGSAKPEDADRLARLALLLEPIGPVNVSDNLAGARWSKLAINCCISTLGTIGGGRLGSLMIHRIVRRLGLELMTEVVLVARRENIRLEKVSGTLDLDWIALTESERLAEVGSPGLLAKHSMLLAVGARYRRMRSSMLSAIERGRTPAVDFLNGEVVDRAKAHGIATPFNSEARKLVHEIASKEIVAGMGAIDELARRVTAQTGRSLP
jgi:2-dehydropantoate 2-reductase